jgi:hypothetical protein
MMTKHLVHTSIVAAMIGSTQPGVKGNLAGTYKLLSHQFNCSPINKLFGCQ